MSKKRKEMWFKVAGLSSFLIILVALMTWLLWPDPRRDLAKAKKSFEDWTIQMKADADSGDFSAAQAKAYDLEKQLLDLSGSSNQEVREDARLMSDALDAGGQYVKVQRIARASPRRTSSRTKSSKPLTADCSAPDRKTTNIWTTATTSTSSKRAAGSSSRWKPLSFWPKARSSPRRMPPTGPRPAQMGSAQAALCGQRRGEKSRTAA